MNKRTADLVAIDPGGVHVGVAVFRHTGETAGVGWECYWVHEYEPQLAEDWLAAEAPRFDAIVIEEFALYPDLALTLTGSQMETSQLIGSLRYIARTRAPKAIVRLQPAAWQQPTQSLLRRAGITSRAKLDRAGPHCLSAELHGWAYLLRSGMATPPVATIQED